MHPLVDQITELVTNLRQQLDEEREAHEETKSNLEAANTNAGIERMTNRFLNEAIRENMAQMAQKTADLEARLAKKDYMEEIMGREIQEVRTELGRKRAENWALKSENSDLKAENQALKAEIVEIKAEVKDVEAQIEAKLVQKEAQTRGKLAKRVATILKLRAEVKEKSEFLEAQKAQIEQQKAQIQKLRAQNDRYEAQKAIGIKQAEDQTARMEEKAEGLMTQLAYKLEEAQMKNQAKDDEIAGLEAYIEDVKARNSFLMRAVTQAEAQSLKMAQFHPVQPNARLQTTIDKLQREKGQLMLELGRIRCCFGDIVEPMRYVKEDTLKQPLQ